MMEVSLKVVVIVAVTVLNVAILARVAPFLADYVSGRSRKP
jgi:hypothetical protein